MLAPMTTARLMPLFIPSMEIDLHRLFGLPAVCAAGLVGMGAGRRGGEQDGMDWRQRAACRGIDTEVFFPSARYGPLAASATRPACRVCDRCPVRRPCLAWALRHEVHGIWGGTTEKERRALRISASA